MTSLRRSWQEGGLCGINIYSRFLTEPDDLGAGQKEQLLRLIDRMLELGGEDVIAWGMDLDGGVTCDPIGTPLLRHTENIWWNMGSAVCCGIRIVDKLSFDNAYRFFYESFVKIKSVAILTNFCIL